jgi:hypothetical protein
MTLKEATSCSRIVYFELDEDSELADEYTYYRRGSSFLCKYKGRLFIVTAEHVIKEDDDLERLLLLSEKDDETILYPDHSIEIQGDEEDFKDVSVFRIAEDIDNDEWQADAIPITREPVHDGRSAYNTNGLLVLSGFPGELQQVDYEKKELRQRRQIVKCKYDSKTAAYKHKMKLPSDHGFKSLAGFSGSPMLCEANGSFGISGIAIQGGSTVVQFVDSAVLWNVFQKFEA